MEIDIPSFHSALDTDFNAKMTNRQFRALKHKLDKESVFNDLCQSSWMKKLSGKAGKSFKEVKKWIINGWSTENLLRHNCELTGNALQASIHWAFPQAYYSVYAHTQALIIALGYTDKSHTTVRKRFGQWVEKGRYPEVISFYAHGGLYDVIFKNIAGTSNEENSLWFDLSVPDSIDHQITQFLSSTRKIDLKTRREEMRNEFKTKKGDVRKRLERKHWKQISDSLGPTTLIDLLYRKRIKSNYRDVSTYHSSDLKSSHIVESLKRIVECCNFIHECFLIKVFGKNRIATIVDEISDSIEFIEDRVDSALEVCYQ